LNKAQKFVALTFTSSWALAAAFFVAGGRLNTAPGAAVLILYMFVPMASAIVVQKVLYRQPVTAPLGMTFSLNWWWLVAWLLPPLIAIATFLAALVLPGIHFSADLSGLLDRVRGQLTPTQYEIAKANLLAMGPMTLSILSIAGGLIAGATVNAVAAFGEEVGWRGLLQREFASMNFWAASALIGVIWGLWHAPIILMGFNYPHHPRAGVLMMIAMTLLLAEGTPVHGVVFRGIRYDTGAPVGYLQAVVQLAAQREDYGPAFRAWLVDFVKNDIAR